MILVEEQKVFQLGAKQIIVNPRHSLTFLPYRDKIKWRFEAFNQLNRTQFHKNDFMENFILWPLIIREVTLLTTQFCACYYQQGKFRYQNFRKALNGF